MHSDNTTDTQMLSLLLRALITLSERGDRVSRVLSGWKPGLEALAKAVAWPGLAVRTGGQCSGHPPWLAGPGEGSKHGLLTK